MMKSRFDGKILWIWLWNRITNEQAQEGIEALGVLSGDRVARGGVRVPSKWKSGKGCYGNKSTTSMRHEAEDSNPSSTCSFLSPPRLLKDVHPQSYKDWEYILRQRLLQSIPISKHVCQSLRVKLMWKYKQWLEFVGCLLQSYMGIHITLKRPMSISLELYCLTS